MSIAQCAAAAVQVFPNVTVSTTQGPLPLRVVMVAISGAETGGSWNPVDPGDRYVTPQYPMCDGYCSWGLWQINNAHYAYLTQQAGSANPCVWAAWLANPVNCAVAAYSVYRGANGLDNWTTYAHGLWVQYIGAAQQAVAAQESSKPPIKPTPPVVQTIPWGAVALMVLGASAASLAVYRPTRQWAVRQAREEWTAGRADTRRAVYWAREEVRRATRELEA